MKNYNRSSKHKTSDFRIGDKVMFCYSNNPANLNRIGTVVEVNYAIDYIFVNMQLADSSHPSNMYFAPNKLEIIKPFDRNIICKKSK